ncbi:MAG: OmpH family outer membrane protein [Pseudomonadales bacterium]|nr:OmpH family outer membrane protein [Pseudomonadales bacterium]
MTDQCTKVKNLYSLNAIALGTFIGGPAAAGTMIRRNYINTGREKQGNRALLIACLATLLIGIVLVLMAETFLHDLPSYVIPVAYTVIIRAIVSRIQGDDFQRQKFRKGSFYSSWRAAGVGGIHLSIIVCIYIAWVFLSPSEYDTAQYDQGLVRLQSNADQAEQLFDYLAAEQIDQAISFNRDIAMPLWQQNLQILQRLDKLEGLYTQLQQQNQMLKEYYQLRLQSFQLIQNALVEDTDAYQQQLQQLDIKIQLITDQLQKAMATRLTGG